MCVRKEEGGEGGGRALPWKGNDLLMERSGLYILAIISRRKVVTRFSRIVADRSRSVYRAMHVNRKTMLYNIKFGGRRDHAYLYSNNFRLKVHQF